MRWPLPGDWPNAHLSRRIRCKPHDWHVQVGGAGPTILLLHGAGGATSSWRDLLPLLARDHHVIAPDLPGHGFTRLGSRSRSGLDQMAEDLLHLCAQESWRPAAVVGHSAGAAIALRFAELSGGVEAVVGLNAALGSFGGAAGLLFPLLAKGLAHTPFSANAFSLLAGTNARVSALLGSTGSRLDARGQQDYLRLVKDAGHVSGTLLMMSQWRLEGLLSRLPRITTPCLLLATEGDRTVPPRVSVEAARLIPNAESRLIPGLGHLAHEEDPALFAEMIAAFVAAHREG